MTRPAAPIGVEATGWGWRHATRASWAVRALDLRIEPGERVLLLGASGAGKSTLLHALAGVLGGPDEGDERGSLRVGGRAPVDARGTVGLILQDPDAQVVLPRVGDDVAFGCENLSVPPEQIWPRVGEALRDVGLAVPLEHPTQELSGGQRQRLALAGVLAMQPGLILLDEPTANIDPPGVREVRDAVAAAVERRGTTLVVVEHRVDVWLPVVDRVIVLEPAGGVMVDGTPDAVFGAHADDLAAKGVWVPGLPAPTPAPDVAQQPETVWADALTVGHGRHAVASFDHVGLERGVSTTVTGPNGAGKTTLALTLAGLLPPVTGEVCVEDRLAAPASRRWWGRRRPERRRPHEWTSRELVTRIGTVFQDPEHQFVAVTVRKELAVGLHALGWEPARIDARVSELLADLRLETLAEVNPFTLSGGEKRRLAVAAVLATEPQVVVLDEPTFGQDRVTWLQVVALMDRLRQRGHTLLSVTHDDDVVAALGQRRWEVSGER